MLSGIKPEECGKCAKEEAAGLESKRLRTLRTSPAFRRPESLNISTVAPISHVGLELGNICNLRCLICNPRASSSWNRDAKAAGYATVPLHSARIEDFRPLIPNLEKLEILGGESFLAPQLEEILSLVAAEGQPERITLQIAINATTLPSPKVREVIEAFGKTVIGCSVDGYGERNEYMRFSSKWPQVEATVTELLRWRISCYGLDVHLQPTISAYSFPGLPRLLIWWRDLNLNLGTEENIDNVLVNYLDQPSFQSVHSLSRSTREHVVANLRTLEAPLDRVVNPIIRFALADDKTSMRAELQRWTEGIDQVRGVKLATVIPEIYEADL